MTQRIETDVLPPPFPDHTQLPESDGTFVKNFQEHPQSILLTDSIGPVLERIHPDGQYAIGQDCGIYWRETEPPEKGAEAPDWFYVPNVPPNLDGEIRRSYVLWREYASPLIALEFASGTGEEERDRTPLNRSADAPREKPGKFWVYEKIIKIPYYGIYEIKTGVLEVYHLLPGYLYEKLEPNERGHYHIPQLGIELGLWQGSYQNQTQLWLRWWDEQGNLLLTGAERAEVEQHRAESERVRAESERVRAESERVRAESERVRADRAERSQREAIPRLLGMGLTSEQVAEALNLTVEQVREMS
ncbi:Uma2 family endonuclease [Laspinema olomoucense]|uniref:Uma2 family endonuclease n=1 Tax=Laspinema olomoucense D3b TaxID=2953688 RepID=A0ABT2N5W1_9CYAN|nr:MULTISPECIES: Uma2 family endonuclease [unclassified Laspinema]MCT7978082.1 Uma2 family endonuclease [Laspinema sp. D3b]MCT7993698.1 Uma2 family endonuclease [Laspinema sp. D3c]